MCNQCNHCDSKGCNQQCQSKCCSRCNHCHSQGEHSDVVGSFIKDFEHEYLEPSSFDLATDVSEDKDNLYVSIHVPGIKMDKIDISVEDNRLRVTGKREEHHEAENRHYKQREIVHGSFERNVYLPCDVDESKATAELGTGVLHIQLPKKNGGKSGIKIKNSK